MAAVSHIFREKADFLGIFMITGCLSRPFDGDAFGARVAQTAIGYYGASTVLNAIFWQSTCQFFIRDCRVAS